MIILLCKKFVINYFFLSSAFINFGNRKNVPLNNSIKHEEFIHNFFPIIKNLDAIKKSV